MVCSLRYLLPIYNIISRPVKIGYTTAMFTSNWKHFRDAISVIDGKIQIVAIVDGSVTT